ncbi:multidrug effflux MFS transporter [Chryseolinea lacunae]|uniref:Multidrug effflux MFS transporter n=1 Tax=Chryseolinea lacunae TaxID=2801331 RepID=A0ABS1KYD9_9BACT|nr:multidrug effflux MFS transporter [Chryseolinea lacunae]
MNKNRRLLTIIILGLLSAIGPFSIDMYLPGFPAIALDLHTTVDMVSYSLASFFVGICVGQLISGPLLDRFGRKVPLITGLTLYILSSIGCALAGSIEMLIVLRFVQALGGCVSMVAPRAIVRDVFPVEENAKIFSLLILILGVSPILAPTVGSYVIATLGWHYVFAVLGLVTAAILLAVILYLPESKQPDPTFSLRPKPILGSFATVLKDPQFYTYASAGGIASAGLFAYLSGSPFVFMKLFGVTEQQYGWIFAVIAAGLITSSQLNSVLLSRFSSEQIMKTVLILQSLVGVTLFAGTAFGVLELYSTIFLIFLFLSCQGFSFPNSAALSMAPFTKEAGSASALMGAIQMGLGALAAASVGALNAQSAMPMTGVMAVCALLGLVILIFGRRNIRYAGRPLDVQEEAIDLVEKC